MTMHDDPPRLRRTPGPPPPAPRVIGDDPPHPRERGGSSAAVYGIVAALGLATVAVLAGGAAMLLGMFTFTDGDVNAGLLGVALAAVLAIASLAGWYIARSLPRGSRGPFWAMFVVCAGSAMVMLFGVCGAGSEFLR